MGHIFISHTKEDSDAAMEIAAGLERAGFKTWYYRRGCAPGPSYLVQTGNAIREADAIIVFVSSRSVGGNQMTLEIVQGHEENKHLFPILLDTTHEQLQHTAPEWREAFGAAVSAQFDYSDPSTAVKYIAKGLEKLGIRAVPSGPEAEQGRKPMRAVASAAGHCRFIHTEITGGPARHRSARKPAVIPFRPDGSSSFTAPHTYLCLPVASD